ncbi:oligosaccharide repeat unit polymerase [Providencia rettgeri]|nr:oligosaccharide repeat unit polymerase [Providencia rettgeri]
MKIKLPIDICSITIIWILFWCSLSYIDPFSLGGISELTFIYVLYFLFVFCFFYIITLKKIHVKTISVEYSDRPVFYLYFIIIIIYLFLLMKVMSILSHQNIWEYRSKAFGSDTETSILFGDQKIRLIYSILIEGAVYFLQFFFLSSFIKKKNYKFLFYGFIIVVLMSIVMLGRSPIYYYILMSIYAVLYLRKGYFSILVPILSSVAVLILFFLTEYRSGGTMDFSYFIDRYLFGYHLYGFNLFELEGGANHFLPDSLWYGQATLGSFSYFSLYPIAKVISPEILYYSSNEYLLKNLGVILNNGSEANAFYTIFYDMFIDFAWLAPLIYGIAFGFIYGIISKKTKANKNINNYMLYFFLLNISLGMIFRNPIATNGFVGFFIYYFIFNYLSIKKIR